SPTSVPARMRCGSSGYTAKARTLHSEGMGFLIRFHVIPPSGLHDRPPPTVPTQSVKSCAMAAPPLQEKLPSYLSHGTIIGQICAHSQRIAFLLRNLSLSLLSGTLVAFAYR